MESQPQGWNRTARGAYTPTIFDSGIPTLNEYLRHNLTLQTIDFLFRFNLEILSVERRMIQMVLLAIFFW